MINLPKLQETALTSIIMLATKYHNTQTICLGTFCEGFEVFVTIFACNMVQLLPQMIFPLH